MRIDGWEYALDAVIAHHAGLPARWGVSDCCILPRDALAAVTGEPPLFADVAYSTEAGAARALRKLGFETLEELFAASLPECPPLAARRGDVGIASIGGTSFGCVIVNGGLAVKAPAGLILQPLHFLTRAFHAG